MRVLQYFTTQQRKYVYLSIVSLVSAFIVLTTLFSTHTYSQSEDSDARSPFESREVIIGVRTAAYEIGHDVNEDGSGGFCGAFGQELEKGLSNKDITVTYRPIENNYLDGRWERYDGLRENIIDIECGPNSLPSGSPSWARGINFSNTPFHTTGVKLLLRKEVLENLSNENPSLTQILDVLIVTVVEKTTTLRLLERIQGLNIRTTDGRDEALDLIERNDNYAYASDALIVRTLLNKGVKELKGENNEIIRKMREPYRYDGFVTFPSDESYIGDVSEEKYVIAIKDGTQYASDLMEAIEDALNSEAIIRKSEELKESETSFSIIANPKFPSSFSSSSTQILIVVFVSLLFLLFILYGMAKVAKSDRRNESGRDTEQAPVSSGHTINVTNTLTSSPNAISENYSGHPNVQKSSIERREEQEFLGLLKEIRGILNSIDSSSTPTSFSKEKARFKGAETYEQNHDLRERLVRALERGTIKALESSLDHPLAVFFIEGFKNMREN